jgi:hypothetical protein
MSRKLRRLAAVALTLLGGCLPASAAPVTWVFEGLLKSVDPELAPDLTSGWVLSGSFALDFIEMADAPESTDLAAGSGRLTGGINTAELTVDLYYRSYFEAIQSDGLAGLDYLDNDPQAEGRDVIGWFLPMSGELKEGEWSLAWLQIWLADPSGRMIRTLPPVVPPRGLDWEHAWFRMTFANAEGETRFAEGPIEWFGPEAAVSDAERSRQWQRIVRELGGELEQRDRELATLRGELEQARERVRGLRTMVDLLVTERAGLEDDNARLRQQARLADPAVEQQIAALQSGKALLEQEISELDQQNLALVDTLEASEQARRQLLDRIAELEAAAPVSNEAVPDLIRGAVASPSGGRLGMITIHEQPMVIEKPPPPPLNPPAANTRPADTEAAPGPRPSAPSRRFGPPKFR